MSTERLDVDALVREIRGEAQALREAAAIAAEAEERLEASFHALVPQPMRQRRLEELRAAVRRAEIRSGLDADVPTASGSRPAAWVKGAVKRLVGWYVGDVTAQVRGYLDTELRALYTALELLEDLHDDLTRLEGSTAALERRADLLWVRVRSDSAADEPPGRDER